MRHVLFAAAALAVGGFVASTAANAQMPYVAGGPNKIGNMCKVVTDDGGDHSFGYYAPCGQQAVASAPRGKRR